MPTVTNYYGIAGEVPFVDVEVGVDNRLYLDPHAIRLSDPAEPFVHRALLCLDTFAAQITKSVLATAATERRRGERLLRSFSEPWETRLGMSSSGFHGHGGGDIVGTWIWDVLTNDVEALVRFGILKQIEDLPLFVDGVDRDITSDITTRIIFDALVKFTAQMLVQYPEFSSGGHKLGTFTKQLWSVEALDWVEVKVSLPVADGKALLLVPVGWARPTLLMSARRYYETSVLTFAQLEQTVVGSDGRLLKTSKARLMTQSGLEPGRGTNLAVTLRAFEDGEDLLAFFKAFVFGRLDRNGPEGKAA